MLSQPRARCYTFQRIPHRPDKEKASDFLNTPHCDALYVRVTATALLFQGASPSLLWPNLIDALYALLRAFSDPQHLGMSHQWVYGALRDLSLIHI